MRVLLNTLCAVGDRSGVGHYTQQVARELMALAPGEVGLYPSGLTGAMQTAWLRQWHRHEARRGGLMALGERTALALTKRAGYLVVPDPLRRALRRGGCDLYHEPNFIPVECDIPAIASVHDLSVLLRPEWHPAHRVRYYEEEFHKGLKGCARLVAISEFGRGEIVRHLGWPAERVSVTYMGVRPGLRRVGGDELAKALRELGLQEGYLLHVGTLEPRKNVLMLLKAYCSLPSEVRDKCPLVLAGGRGWNSGETHAFLEAEARHKNVRWLGYVRDESFPALYSGARALLFPTFYEGFGMPAIEMMACGGAVLASTAGALVEVCGGKAHLIDPLDADGWRDAMLRACTDDDWIATLRDGAEEAAAPFTWRGFAEATVGAYRLALGEGRRAA